MMITNKFLFSEQSGSHANVISIMRANGGHTYKSRWANVFAKLAGSKNHYFRLG